VLVAVVEHARAAAKADPPEAAPVLLVVIDEDCDVGPGAGVLDALQLRRTLWLAVNRCVKRVAIEREHDRDEVRPAVRIRRRQSGHSRCCQSGVAHFG
jgi:hypothetical protein